MLMGALAAPAGAQAPQQWDGSNPFTCTVQNGASPANPNADPFCVEYGHSLTDPQAITDLLTNGPTQLAAKANKCFLYEQDHFTGLLGQEVDTAMFVNKATGTSGTAITKSTIPSFPPGVGGMGSVPVVQSCTGNAQGGGGPVTGGGGGGGGSAGGGSGGGSFLGTLSGPDPGVKSRSGVTCKKRNGNANNGLGRARLGLTRAAVAKRFGTPTRRRVGFYHYCLKGGGDLAVHFGRHGKSDVAMTNGKNFHAGKVKIGSRLTRVRSSLRHEKVLGHSRRDWVFGVTHKHWRLLVGLSRNRVVYIAAVSRSLSLGKLGKVLNDAGR
jgi:hypothetical protein